jgi:hypothetical protein
MNQQMAANRRPFVNLAESMLIRKGKSPKQRVP